MPFNFKEKYSTYSNIELLKIIKQAQKFQPEAVNVASTILKERTITVEELNEVEVYIDNLEQEKIRKTQKATAYKDKANDFFEPVIKPSSTVKPEKWLNLFLLFLALQYIWSIFNSIKFLILFYNCSYCSIDPTIIFSIATLLYIPIIFYLLYKRKVWGWILLFADNIITFIVGLSNLYFYFSYPQFWGSSLSNIFFSLFLNSGLVYFLWRSSIASLFGVKEKTKNDTLFYSILLAVSYLAAMIILYA